MKPSYAGMTVNERLYASGLMNDFDRAVKAKDQGRVIGILREVAIDENSIKAILKSRGFSLDIEK